MFSLRMHSLRSDLISTFTLCAALLLTATASSAEVGFVTYFGVRATADLQYQSELGLALSAQNAYVVREVVGGNRIDEVASAPSASPAASYLVPKEADGAIYTVLAGALGNLTVKKFDPVTLAQVGGDITVAAALATPASAADDVVLREGFVYFRSGTKGFWSWYNTSTSTSGDFPVEDNADAVDRLVSDGVNLVLIQPRQTGGVPDPAGQFITFKQLGPLGVRINTYGTGNFFRGGMEAFTAWKFAMDGDRIYCFRVELATGVHEVWLFDVNSTSGVQLIFRSDLIEEAQNIFPAEIGDSTAPMDGIEADAGAVTLYSSAYPLAAAFNVPADTSFISETTPLTHTLYSTPVPYSDLALLSQTLPAPVADPTPPAPTPNPVDVTPVTPTDPLGTGSGGGPAGGDGGGGGGGCFIDSLGERHRAH